MLKREGTVRKRRTHDLRRIRRTVTYSVRQIVELLGVHPNTVHGWINRGLATIEATPPYLVHGADLYAFVKRERARRKRPCGSGEMFCFRCRLPRPAVPGSVTIDFQNPKKVKIKGQCRACGTWIYRAGSARKVHDYEIEFATPSTGMERMGGPLSPLDNCEKRKEARHG